MEEHQDAAERLVARIMSLSNEERSSAIDLLLNKVTEATEEPLVVHDRSTGLATGILCRLDGVQFVERSLELKRRCLLLENAKKTGDFQSLDPVDGATISAWTEAK